MAHIDDGGGHGRSTVVDVNIVPFIDLMSVLIIFLLISAVWTQVSMIQIGSSIYGKKTELETTKVPPLADVPFRVDVLESGYRIIIARRNFSLPKLNNQYDKERLLTELTQIKEQYPQKLDAVITMRDELAYEYLIQGMDALLKAGFPEISIATGGAR